MSSSSSPVTRVLTIIFALLFLGGLGYGLINYWVIRDIRCLERGEDIPTICKQLEPLKGKSIFFTNLDQSILYSQVLKNQQGQAFQAVDYYKQLPNTLVIDFKKKNPSYRLKFKEEIYLANIHNFLAQDDEQFSSLPMIEITDFYQPQINPPHIEPELNSKLIKLVELCDQFHLPLNTAKIDRSQSELNIDNWQFIFEYEQVDWLQMLPKAKVIIDNLDQPDHRSAKFVVDMRFNLPVLKSQASFDQELLEQVEATFSSQLNTESESDSTGSADFNLNQAVDLNATEAAEFSN